MKHVKDRMKDGLMLIMVMVGVMISGMAMTACSNEEDDMICYEHPLKLLGMDKVMAVGTAKKVKSETGEWINSIIPDGDPNYRYCIALPESADSIIEGIYYEIIFSVKFDEVRSKKYTYIYPEAIYIIEDYRRKGDCGITNEISNFAPIDWSSLIGSGSSEGVDAANM